MKVTIFYPVPLYYDGIGYTSDSVTFNSISNWASHFARTDLVTFLGDGKKKKGVFGIDLRGMPVDSLPFPENRAQQYFLLAPAIVWKLCRIIASKRGKREHVILFDMIFPNWLVFMLCRLFGISVAVRLVGRYDLFVKESLQHEGWIKKALGNIYGGFLRNLQAKAAEEGIVVTDGHTGYLRQDTAERIGFCVESHIKEEDIPPRNPYQVRADGEEIRILSISRIHPAKGIHVLIDAVNLLLKEGEKIHLDIVGPNYGGRYGNYFEFIEKKIRSMATDRVRYRGLIEEGIEIERYWKGADIFIVPYTSDADGVPRVIMEAMSRGIPMVATAVGGIPKVIRQQQTGLLVHPNDVNALAAAIRRVVSQPGLRMQLSEKAYAEARQYTAEAVSEKLSGMLLNPRGGSDSETVSASKDHRAQTGKAERGFQ